MLTSIVISIRGASSRKGTNLVCYSVMQTKHFKERCDCCRICSILIDFQDCILVLTSCHHVHTLLVEARREKKQFIRDLVDHSTEYCKVRWQVFKLQLVRIKIWRSFSCQNEKRNPCAVHTHTLGIACLLDHQASPYRGCVPVTSAMHVIYMFILDLYWLTILESNKLANGCAVTYSTVM